MAVTVRVQLGDALAGGDRVAGFAALRRLLTRAVRFTLKAEGVRAAEISVTLLDDAEIADMNTRFLQHEGPTDVISFALFEDDEDPVGDVYIGIEQASRQAMEAGAPTENELVRLTVHGVLHVLGYEHPDGAERVESEMWQRQEGVVADVLSS